MNLQHNKKAALYCRLSRDDRDVSESDSIQNQELMLSRFASVQGFKIVDVYKDDGYTGTNFDRPDFMRMLSDLKTGRADTVVVKDLSRFGREHIQADLYREIEFPAMGVRLIAINDNYDSAAVTHSTNSMAQIRTLFNEWFAADTSEKVKRVLRMKMEAGQYLGGVPYGYQRNPENAHRLVPDEETAPVVRRIFDMAVDGLGHEKIARTLALERIPTPAAYSGRKTRKEHYTPYDWNFTTVREILNNPVYLGHTYQGRYATISFKIKQVERVPADQWIKVENTHEPLVTQNVWDMAHKAMQSRKRSTKKGTPHMFAGLLKCADCGFTLAKDSRDNFTCLRYKMYGRENCTSHYIPMKKLYMVVLASVQAVTEEIQGDRDEFIERLSGIGERQQRQRTEAAYKEKNRIEKRLAELPKLLKRAFEQNVAEKLPDSLYETMLSEYSGEETELTTRLESINAAIGEAEASGAGIRNFVTLVEKYTEVKELNSEILHELIEKIVVHQTELVDGQKVQQIDIYYRFIGQI